jgi:phenylacetate-CoA ligase
MQAYQFFFEKLILPFSDLILGQSVSKTLTELRGFQWNSLEEINSYRNRKVHLLLTQATERIAYYQDVKKSLNLCTNSMLSYEDLQRFPILEKKTIREQGDRLIDPRFIGRKYKMMSSGSTGVQTTVWSDAASMNEVYATQLLFWEWGGFKLADRHLQTGMSLDRGVTKKLKDYLFRCNYFSAFGLTDKHLRLMLDQIDRKKIEFVFGYASSIYLFAKYIESIGETRQLRSVFTWGDSLFPHYRQSIERVFRCKVSDCYGLGEGLQCAAQCELHDGLHEAMHGVVVEIVDSNGMPCPIGEIGRVIVTRLEHGCMPLIRYDTGDIASFLPEPCPCGRKMRLLSRIQGRATDIVSTPYGDRLIVHFFTQLFEMVPQIHQFQVRQEQADRIQVLYVASDKFEMPLLDQLRKQIQMNCKFPLQVDFVPVSDIPLEKSNKRRFVISSIPL